MSKLNIDPSDDIAMMDYVSLLTNTSSVLENSKPILFNPIPEGKIKLTNTIKYGDISLESLAHQLNRVESMMEVTLENSIPLELETQSYMVETANRIKNRIELESDKSYILESTWLDLFTSTNKRDNYNLASFSQSEVEDVFINENMSKLDDLLTIVENETINSLSVDSINLLVMATVESCIDLEKGSDLICEKVNGPLTSMISNNYIEAWEALQAVDHIMRRFDKIYSVENEESKEYNQYQYIKAKLDNTISKLKNSIEATHEVSCGISLPLMESMILSNLNDIVLCKSENDMINLLNEFARLDTIVKFDGEDIMLEAKRHGGNVRKATASIARRSKKTMTRTAKKIQKSGQAIGTAKKKTVDPMEKFIESTFNKIKKADMNTRKDMIIKGGVVPKVMRFIRRAITIGGVGLISPAVAGISLLTYIALDKSLDAKARRKVLSGLENELELVNEKIEDSKGDEDKQKKYELMRIKQKLQADIVRIRHGLD